MNQDDHEFLESFYRAIPDGPLEPGDPRYWAIYDDPRLVRWDPVEQLARGIEWADGGHIQLLAGSRGCGKSTELRRLARRLEDAGHLVAMGDASVLASYRREGLFSGLAYILALVAHEKFNELVGDELYAEFRKSWPALEGASIREIMFPRSEEKALAAMSKQVSSMFEGKPDFSKVSLEALRRLVSAVREKADSKIVILLDSLDQVLEIGGLAQSAMTRLQLQDLYLVLVVDAYTAEEWQTWPQLYGEPRWVEPMATRGSDFGDVIRFFSTRLAKLGEWRRLLGEDTLRKFLEISGGCLEEVFYLLGQLALNAKSLPPHHLVVETVIQKVRRDLSSDIDSHDIEIIQALGRGVSLEETVGDSVELDKSARILLQSGLVHYRHDLGFFVHPLLASTLEGGKAPASVDRTFPAAAGADSPWIEEVLQIRHFTIENIRVFEEFQLEPRLPDSEQAGQWTLLLGDNGVGKTTILRSLVLALADRRAADALFQLLGPSAPFLRQAAEEGRVEVRVDGYVYRVTLTRDRRGIEKISDVHGSDVGIPVFAYGCQRGTALGGPDRDVELRPLDEVRSLFDPTANLIHAETWLSRLRLAALEERGGADESFFEAVRETLVKSLHRVDAIGVDKNGVWLQGPNVGRAPLAALSDGYITTAGWILDLIARWSDRCRKLGMALDGDFRESMTGLVLIDEIDLHLHPLWQVDVVRDLRQLFPRLSFVATTHNPLTLLGAHAGEVHVLRRDSDGRVVSAQHDIPPGARADQVLTGDWFGLPSTVDPETLDLLDQHRNLLLVGAPRDDPARTKLEGELRRRLGTFADTSLDRMVQGIAAHLMPEDFEELSPEERLNLRQRILERARARRGAA